MFRKHKSATAIKAHLSDLIADGKLDSALHIIHDFVDRIITEPLCTSQIFASRDLDVLCQEIGKKSLVKKHINKIYASSAKVNQSTFTYIVTKLQKSGGHTQVIKDFIMARPQAKHIILSTEIEGKSESNYVISLLAKDVSVEFEAAPKGSYLKRLIWLQQRLQEIEANDNYLFNHHQDSIAVAAIQPEMQIKASFYHHGDHHLCLGVHLKHLQHIDPHPMGYHYCRDELSIDNIYIPFAIDDKGVRSKNLGFKDDGLLTTCTAARSNKLEVPYYVNYVDVIPALLNVTGGKHIHIGRLSLWALYKIRKALKQKGLSKAKFIYVPWVPSVWVALHEFRVDLYIASFPYGGGITLIEAMGAGVPVALHKHIYSRVLSGIDLAYPSVFYWSDPERLFDFCANVSKNDLKTFSRLARMHFEQFHQFNILQDILLNDVHIKAPDNILDSFHPQTDEWAHWMEGQVTLVKLLKRSLYRMLKRMRTYFS